MARGRSLPAALALAALLTCAREAVPPELVGQWKSDDPRYADRSLAIGTELLTFGAGAEGSTVYRVRGIEREGKAGAEMLYRVYYDAPGEPERALQLRLPAPGQLSIENHSELWTRVTGAPASGG
jgi:hypothetical protein